MLFLQREINLTCIFEIIQEYEKIFLAVLFRLANNDNQPFFHNAYEIFDFSQQKKFAKYFAKFVQKFQQ